MYVIPESVAATSITIDEAIEAVRAAFIALAEQRAEVFPVVTGTGSDPGNGFAVKSARLRLGAIDGASADTSAVALGMKIGTYWPGNVARQLVSHASTVLLLDDDTGFPTALVGASHLTALRTAAADAVAVDVLARPEASRVVIIGTGHQAYVDALAIARVREVDDVAVCGRDPQRAAALAARLAEAGLPASPGAPEAVLPAADIVCTVTSAREPLVSLEMLRLGVHISAMGADSPGKHELALDIIETARCVADIPAQSVTIGEFQHAAAAGLLTAESVTPLGAILCGAAPGRRSEEEITVFDSSGTAIQDLAVCACAAEAAIAAGDAIAID